LTGEINQRCKYRYSKYCRDGKEANMLYYITILKVLFMGLEQHMLLSISSHSYRWNVAFIPVAITKFTDQSVAHNANKTPFSGYSYFYSKNIVLNELINFSMLQ
jgi:hypothetical protein